MGIISESEKGHTAMSVTVCMGSSCHLKGSYEIIEFLKESIKARGLESKVIFRGSFCMEKCTDGVSVKVNDEIFSVSSIKEMEHIFQDKIIRELENHDVADKKSGASASS